MFFKPTWLSRRGCRRETALPPAPCSSNQPGYQGGAAGERQHCLLPHVLQTNLVIKEGLQERDSTASCPMFFKPTWLSRRGCRRETALPPAPCSSNQPGYQ